MKIGHYGIHQLLLNIWLIALDHDKFFPFSRILSQNMEKDIYGSHLKHLDTDDLLRFGVLNPDHRINFHCVVQ